MGRIGKLRGALLVAVAVAAAASASVLLVTRSGHASGATRSQAVVKDERNAMLGKRVLVTRGGLTLYSLSAERKGRFICTSAACVALWKPLVVGAGVKPTGVDGLATVMRPDGRRQVAFHGAPLYRFVQDRKAGEANGNGFRDVGVWRPVTVGSHAGAAPVAPAKTTPSYSYGY